MATKIVVKDREWNPDATTKALGVLYDIFHLGGVEAGEWGSPGPIRFDRYRLDHPEEWKTAQEAAEKLARLMGTPGEPVPPVDAADLNSVWSEFKELRAQGKVVTGMGLLERVCSSGADMRAVGFRFMQLGLLTTVYPEMLPQLSQLAPIVQNGELTETALKVGARFPMKWLAVGVEGQMPFDLEAFIAEVQKESAAG